MKVFLSHASDQKPLAEKVAFSLRDRGFQVFLDKDDLPAGKSYDAQIEAAVNASDMMVYLISPQSVTRGRYTLTELEYARRRWGTPHNRVLPVMAEPTGMAEIPEFLKAVTLLQPQGNAAAEISAAVAQLGSQRRHQALMVLLACGLVSGVLSAVSQLFGSAFNPGFLGTPIIPGLLLGVALAGAVFVLLRPSVVGLLLIFAVTQVSWHLAVQSAVAVHQEFKVETRTVKTELGGTDDVFKVKFDPSMILPGLVGGFSHHAFHRLL